LILQKTYPYIPSDKDYAEFIIRTVKKTVKQEDSLVRQIVYTALSKDSSNPQNLAVLAPTSEGKTHAVLETLKIFPKNRLWKIGSMSPKVIIRQNGVLVDSNNEPLEPRIKEIKRQIRNSNTNEEQKEELQDELNQLYNEAKVLIDLTGRLFVFLEPPHHDTWNILKPILSHDDYEIEHPYVYEVEGMGFKVKKIVTRGWPACIFCSARNESKWPQWPEIQSRFLITSPNMIKQKYLEGNILIAQRKGLPRLAQQSLIVSDSDVELAKKCFIYLIEQIKKLERGEISSIQRRDLDVKLTPVEIEQQQQQHRHWVNLSELSKLNSMFNNSKSEKIHEIPNFWYNIMKNSMIQERLGMLSLR
jgi:hypothetical protein